MGYVVGSIAILLSIAFVIEKATDFLNSLKSSKTLKVGKGFEAKLSIAPLHNKSEDSPQNKSSLNDKHE